jgi:ATP-binding cassette subfamily C exporter for protease/lipase
MLIKKLSGEPGEDLTPLRQALEECRGAVKFVALLTFILAILVIAPMLYMMNVFDRVLPTKSYITLFSLLSVVIGVYFLSASLEWLRRRVLVRISLRIDWDMAGNVFNACFKKSLSHKDPNVHQVMGDLLTLRSFMTGQAIIALIDAPFAFVFLAFAFMIHPLLALFIGGCTLVMVLITLYTRKITSPAIQAATKHNNEANRQAAAGLKNVETALAMGMLPVLRRRWHGRHRTFLQYQVNASEASGFVGMIGGVFTKAMPSLQMTASVFLHGAGLISTGGVIAAAFIISRAVAPFKDVIEKWEDIVKARMAYERLDELLELQRQSESKMSLPAPQGHIEVQEFTFRAPDSGREILRNLNFDLPAGQCLAVVGPNAAGKSSLLKAVLGLVVPSEGAVRLDGAEVCNWNHDELGPHIGYVGQKPELFEATVAENIARLGEVDADRVVEAAKLAGIHEVILSFPEGYDTVLCGAGFQLSGGQAQRVAIARAFYNNPKLLVLDEPNAALDDPAETALLAALEVFKKRGATILFSSHRPRLIAVSDWMLVLKHGQQLAFANTADTLSRTKFDEKSRVAGVDLQDDAPAIGVPKGLQVVQNIEEPAYAPKTEPKDTAVETQKPTRSSSLVFKEVKA